jgi:hypothetical protein
VISCGTYSVDAVQTQVTVNLGYEPQWLFIKRATGGTGAWYLFDNMRGITTGGDDAQLQANSTGSEAALGGVDAISLTSTGFQTGTNATVLQPSSDYIYIAIRRGPMKVPTTGTSVYTPFAATTSGSSIPTGFPADTSIQAFQGGGQSWSPEWCTRLTGQTYLTSSSTSAEAATTIGWDSNTSIIRSVSSGRIYWNFRRAPGFFDEVCSNATSTGQTLLTHNLGVAPEMIIKKLRNGTANWHTWASGIPFGDIFDGPSTDGAAYTNGSLGNTTPPSATQFQTYQINTYSYVYYLFASAPGVSKVFSYTGNGSSQTINCGFTGGARFVMVKRTDSTGNWLVVDTARGLVSAGDPTLYLNSTAAEVTGVDWIDPDNSGFIVNQEGTMNANVSSATYIGLAIA